MTKNNDAEVLEGFKTVPDAIEAFAKGGMVIVVDAPDREAEGDLILAADHVTPENINFMISKGRGLLCIAMDRDRLAHLGISRMPSPGSGDPYRTAFMESVDAREGVTTGISAHDRAKTVKVLVDPATKPSDLVRPGHLFPLEAVKGGVLNRPGHTEAAVDLAQLAGLSPAGVICEILNEDGTMARAKDLVPFAKEHNLPMISVEDLVRYRQLKEKLVHRTQTIAMPTEFGVFDLHMYEAPLLGESHVALVMGDLSTPEPVLARVHSECLTGDVFGSLRCDCGSQIQQAIKMIAEEGRGAVLYMRQEGRGIGLSMKISAYALQEQGYDTVEANHQLGFAADLRDYGLSAQMFRDLGVRNLRLITNNPQKITGLQTYGLDVTERVPLVLPHTNYNKNYLDTKKKKLGHLL